MSDFIDLLQDAWPVERWHNERTIVAVSGGADSVALLRSMHEVAEDCRDKLIAAHFNHRLRGEASVADEEFVRQLAEELGLSCFVGHAGDKSLNEQGQNGVEAAARTVRYGFLRKLADEQGARYIVTAHTADDQVETVLHRILRGTGIVGLAGIPPVRRLSELTTLIRPMLGISRRLVLEYLEELGQSFREDESNASDEFTRNRIRHQLLPQLEHEFNPQVRDSLYTLALQAADSTTVFDALVEHWGDDVATNHSVAEAKLDANFLREQPAPLIRHFLLRLWQKNDWPLQGMNFDHWEALASLFGEESSAAPGFDLPGGLEVRFAEDGDHVILRLPRSE